MVPILKKVSSDSRFTFYDQFSGHWFYNERWSYDGLHVTFSDASVERKKSEDEIKALNHPKLIEELTFHPNMILSTGWKPNEGILVNQYSLF